MEVSVKTTLQVSDALVREAGEGLGQCVSSRGRRHETGRGRQWPLGEKRGTAGEWCGRQLCEALNNRRGVPILQPQWTLWWGREGMKAVFLENDPGNCLRMSYGRERERESE